ncbi:MAG TPA: DegT/DnrJ/EryC1/StrS family aminotransferase [Humidesulfovibrio sp.]|uniref:DegT/DnrJ/EryC1/StrS family aminotransferase n=1 Tax=Humidesulfovibrio sp. TaxID=2910988 RepID=UPI002B6EBD0A|nr:DegT/DnrJ/EryC1/StrS family aminotransferase [Humidesulfovibrio sp.]HWR02773.1 DegT/DnrJ/EryC1/StrS family aminotransferase [Humidesulfovibrio sp.]
MSGESANERIFVSGPWVTELEVSYVAEAARTAWLDKAGVFNARFEKAFAEYMGSAHAASLPSCTSGLHLALAALGVGPGDEVIVPDLTWIASAAPVSYVGATPVFADVDRATWCMDAASFESLITPRTKAVIPVDLYGGMPDYDALLAVAARHNIPVIEDAAEALGSQWKGARAGKLGRIGVFSFHGSKTMTTGEGGMLVTDDDALFARIQFLRDHGRIPGDVSFVNAEVAFKYKMSALQAAFGLAQLERVEELVAKKRQIFSWYEERLRGLPGVTLNAQPDGMLNSYWMVTIVLDPALAQAKGLDKARLMALFKAQNIDTRPFFSPLSSIPAYADTDQGKAARARNAASYAIGPYGLNLPCGMSLTEAQAERVCASLKDILNSKPAA